MQTENTVQSIRAKGAPVLRLRSGVRSGVKNDCHDACMDSCTNDWGTCYRLCDMMCNTKQQRDGEQAAIAPRALRGGMRRL